MRSMNALSVLQAVIVAIVISVFLGSSGPGASADLPPGCAGVKTCQCCHEEVMKQVGKSGMGRLFLQHPRTPSEELVCEACHGPGQAHADSQGEKFEGLIRFAKGSSTPVKKRNEACLQCHQRLKLLAWAGSPHEMRDLACTNCHNIHKRSTDVANRKLLSKPTAMEVCDPCHKKQVAQQMSFSHMPLREGKMDCSSCHNPHGTFADKLVMANSTNELCYSCHKEKRGPFLFEHQPVPEDCSNCHSSHGSNYERMLKSPQLRLCRQCHDLNMKGHGLGAPPGGQRNVRYFLNRTCTDCHFNIHGSNFPSARGKLFFR